MALLKSAKTPPSNIEAVMGALKKMGDPKTIAGMARFGIVANKAVGVSMPQLRRMAASIGCNHALATQLWATEVYEARILAALTADPDWLTKKQARSWAGEFENWADCDGVCLHLFRKTSFAGELATEWILEPEEFVKRAGFTMMATLAVHDKAAVDGVFLNYLMLIEQAACDDRNGVKKAVNWALRQIGKRNATLRKAAIHTAESIRLQGSRSARWIASDALRELNKVPIRKTRK